MTKRSIQQEDITLVHIYASNVGALIYIKHILTDINGDTDSNTIIVGDFNTPVTSMDRPSRQKVNKETLALDEFSVDRLNRYIQKRATPKLQNTHSFQVHKEYPP